jgi:hypothetical protein
MARASVIGMVAVVAKVLVAVVMLLVAVEPKAKEKELAMVRLGHTLRFAIDFRKGSAKTQIAGMSTSARRAAGGATGPIPATMCALDQLGVVVPGLLCQLRVS